MLSLIHDIRRLTLFKHDGYRFALNRDVRKLERLHEEVKVWSLMICLVNHEFRSR